jgi:hypothetical protein
VTNAPIGERAPASPTRASLAVVGSFVAVALVVALLILILWFAESLKLFPAVSDGRLAELADGPCPVALAPEGPEMRLALAVMSRAESEPGEFRVGDGAAVRSPGASACAFAYLRNDFSFGLARATYDDAGRLATIDFFDRFDGRLEVAETPSWRLWVRHDGPRTYLFETLHGTLYVMRAANLATLRPVGRAQERRP